MKKTFTVALCVLALCLLAGGAVVIFSAASGGFACPHETWQKRETVEPRCESVGYSVFVCADCGKEEKRDFRSPLGHDFERTVVEPLCLEEGYSRNVCRRCSYAYDDGFTAPLGHHYLTGASSFTTAYADGSTFRYCERCDACYTEYDLPAKAMYPGSFCGGNEAFAVGADISSHNGDVDFDLLAPQVDFLILRAGTTKGKDSRFETYYASAKAHGIDVGCYFYTYATTVTEILADADALLSWIEGKKFEYPVYLDLEDAETQGGLTSELRTEMVHAFLERLQSNGWYGGLYVNRNWLDNFLVTETVTDVCDLWLARWLNEPTGVWPQSFGADRPGLWQYSGQGQMAGNGMTYIDLDIAFKDYPAWMKTYHRNGY